MTSITDLLRQGAGHLWLFVPSAILLGALHGLEPGHSKTLMAAFIIAVRGTVRQAVLLGLAATASHTAVVWLVAVIGLYLGRRWGGEDTEPYFQLASAAIIIGIALWMAWRTWRERRREHGHHDAKRVTTGTGTLTLEVFEDGVPPRWRIRAERGPLPEADEVTLETLRPGGARQVFDLVRDGDMLRSLEVIPEPHAFEARISIGTEIATVDFVEHDHDHMDMGDEDDTHARAHAADIRRRFEGRAVTTGQIVMFGLTGGLIPCPAAITVLLLCIQLKQVGLGFVLVLCFGIGLALTMVSAGVIAALSVRHLRQRWSGFGNLARRAPYLSVALVVIVGLYTGWTGWQRLQHAPSDAGTTHAATFGDPMGVPATGFSTHGATA